MAWHRHYWSIGKFADWVRGTDKLRSGTSGEWYQWSKASKEKHPIRYWIVEEGFDYVQDFLTWPARKINDISYYINNRWVTRPHALTASRKDIRPGEWCDLGERFLPCMFNELVDFVEIETAWHHIAWADAETRAKYDMPTFRSRFSSRTWRCPQSGIDHLNWSASLVYDEDSGTPKDSELYGKPTYQAECAKTILELYYWWKNVHANRPDPYVLSGWHELCDRRHKENPEDGFMFEDKTPETHAETLSRLDALHEIEKRYEDEDTAMMVKLIGVRGSLWT